MKKRKGFPLYKRGLFLLAVLTVALAVIRPAEIRAASGKSRGKTTWKITQYGNLQDRRQSMFYSIKGSNGKVILIDSGLKENADRTRRIIRGLGNRVDLWIITHQHPDHVGGFNEILKNPRGIKVKRIWAPNIKEQVYRKYKRPWDDFSAYQEFRTVVRGRKNVKWIKKGQSLDFGGLHFKFFNSYYNGLKKVTKDICNGSSLVFKVSGSKTSMLFSGDVDVKVGKALVKKYGKQLRATYMQAPHHGNNKGRNSYFNAVKPKEVFVDAPSFLLRYKNVKNNLKYFSRNRIKIRKWKSSGKYQSVKIY